MTLVQKPHRVDSRFHWTNHVQHKMLFYRLSEGRIRRVIANPKRREDGVAPNTAALMQRNDTLKRKEEIWVMISEKSKIKMQSSKFLGKTIVISAWRYPGISKIGKEIPMPDGLMGEVEEVIKTLSY